MIQRYKIISLFYQRRTPLIILLAGAPAIGKSMIATCLAERLNISNVLSTDMVDLVLRSTFKRTLGKS